MTACKPKSPENGDIFAGLTHEFKGLRRFQAQVCGFVKPRIDFPAVFVPNLSPVAALRQRRNIFLAKDLKTPRQHLKTILKKASRFRDIGMESAKLAYRSVKNHSPTKKRAAPLTTLLHYQKPRKTGYSRIFP